VRMCVSTITLCPLGRYTERERGTAMTRPIPAMTIATVSNDRMRLSAAHPPFGRATPS
jgi:hypothetical protein